MGAGIHRQLKSNEPNAKNPLGRILKVYDDNRMNDTETLELKLDEAILREAPSLVIVPGLQEKGATIRAFDPGSVRAG